MTKHIVRKLRCAIYTRKSTDEGLEKEFNSLDAQREAAEAFITSQKHEGWVLLSEPYDDGGLSGGSLERPALQRLLEWQVLEAVQRVVMNEGPHRPEQGQRLRSHVDHAADLQPAAQCEAHSRSPVSSTPLKRS